MKVETTPLENRVMKVIVEASPEEVESARHAAAKKLGRKIRIPGFRPGKAPYNILLKNIDPVLLQQEIIDIFIDEVYPKILESENINPFSQGKLNSIISIDPLKLEIHIPLQPLVELGDYRSIRIPFEPPLVTDEMVEKAISRVRQQNAVIEPIDRPVQEDDVVYIDLVGYRRENGENTDQIVVEKKDLPIQILTSIKNDSWEYPFRGFSQLFIGKQINDQVAVDYNFPEDSSSLTFQGQDIHFVATIKEIKHRVLPEANDEFAQSVGEYSSMEELRSTIRSMLEKDTLEDYLADYDDKIINELINRSKIEYPNELAETERNAYLEDLNQKLRLYNTDIVLYNKMRGVSDEQFEQEVNEIVDRRVKATLALLEVAKKENIRIDPNLAREESQKAVKTALENSKGVRIPKQVLEDVTAQLSEQNMMDQVIAGAVVKLRSIAKGEEAETGQDNNSEAVSENAEGNKTENDPAAMEQAPISEAIEPNIGQSQEN
ncbi:MAG: trigger factor [Anaerolineales bacterium]